MAGTGEYTIADLAELFTVSRTTAYRTLQRIRRQPNKTGDKPFAHLRHPSDAACSLGLVTRSLPAPPVEGT